MINIEISSLTAAELVLDCANGATVRILFVEGEPIAIRHVEYFGDTHIVINSDINKNQESCASAIQKAFPEAKDMSPSEEVLIYSKLDFMEEVTLLLKQACDVYYGDAF